MPRCPAGLLRKMQSEFKLELGGLLDTLGGPLARSAAHARPPQLHAAAAAAAAGVTSLGEAAAGGAPPPSAQDISAWRARTAPGYASCHRSLIFLGDLARYREQHRDGAAASAGGGGEVGGGRDWTAAAICYQLALRVLPSIGNPHNQLAVLATYDDDEFGALYRYCRSLCLARPFDTARDNLLLLLGKNAPKMARLGTNHHKAPEPAVVLPRFRTRFVRLHAILLTQRPSSKSAEPAAAAAAAAEVQSCVMQDIAWLHRAGDLGPTLVCQLLLVNAFTLFQLHTAARPPPPPPPPQMPADDDGGGDDARPPHSAAALASVSCSCAFTLVCATFSMLVGLELKGGGGGGARHPVAAAPPASRTPPSILGSLVMCAEWLATDVLLLVNAVGPSFELPVWSSALRSLSQVRRGDESGLYLLSTGAGGDNGIAKM
jgi:hypothetical protein